MNGVKAWSYSAYALYKQCPLKYKLTKIDKLKEPQSKAMARGNAIHKKCEDYLVSTQEIPVPKEALTFRPQMEQLKGLDPFVEQKWGFTNQWDATKGFFGKDVWLRVICDAGVIYPDNTADVVDFKTGKLYDTNEEQIELFANAVMFRYDHITHVTARLWYLDSGDEIIREFSRTERDKVREKWEKQIYPMFTEEVFAPRPNNFCKWCHFRKDNGGPCPY